MKISTPARALAAFAAAIAFAGLTACHEHHTDVVTAPAGASPAGQLIGTPPAPPTGDPPGTTPIAANTTEVTKTVETQQKPQEGDNHSYSSVAPENAQKAGGVDGQQQPEREAAKTGISPEGAAVGNEPEKKEQKYEVKVAQ